MEYEKPGVDTSFKILEDIDMLLYSHLNFFIQSISDKALEPGYLGMSHDNQTTLLSGEVRSQFASEKVNEYFHQMHDLLTPHQQQEVEKLHESLSVAIKYVFDHYHTKACAILTPE